ncbi:unnamed protein product [Boreogadus saida]
MTDSNLINPLSHVTRGDHQQSGAQRESMAPAFYRRTLVIRIGHHSEQGPLHTACYRLVNHDRRAKASAEGDGEGVAQDVS